MKQVNLLDILSAHFLICNEKIEDRGEDSGFESYNSEAGIIGAFDGCGGLGSKMCSNLSNKTEAYIASRAICNAVRLWFQKNCFSGYTWDKEVLKKQIVSCLKICESNAGESGLKLKGSLVRPFPSTIAMVTFSVKNDRLVTNHFWAGDSRTFVLDKSGLSQISVDDIKGEDAMSNLTRDGALTNVLSADGNFDIHSYEYTPQLPCIILSSSDGCFGYVSSPMEFELMILDTLNGATNVVEWQQLLNREISTRAGDDQTLAVAAFGFDKFISMKNYYKERCDELNNIVNVFNDANDDMKQQIWNRYKADYYRCSAN